MTEKTPKSFRLTPEITQKIQEAAKKCDMSEGAFVAKCVTENIDSVTLASIRIGDLMSDPQRLAEVKAMLELLVKAKKK